MEKSIQQEQFVMTYEFNAPKELVFGAFSTAEALNEWWGPVGMNSSVVKLDFRKGGIFHFKMESGGKVNYGRFLFITIQSPDLLEFTNAFADEHANVVKAPFDIPLPDEILYRFSFTERNGKTILHMTATPVNASRDEIEGFLSINEGMQQGFGASFDVLAAYLDKVSSQ